MKQYVLKNRKTLLTIIALYQIIGSAVMFYLLYSVVGPDSHAGQYFALSPLLILTLISLFAGVFYFAYGERTRFFLLSKLNFCLHIIQISVAGFAFAFYYGPYLSIGMNGDLNFLLKFELLMAYFNFHLGETAEHFVRFNLVPILPLIILRWAERNPVKNDLENAFTEEEPAQ